MHIDFDSDDMHESIVRVCENDGCNSPALMNFSFCEDCGNKLTDHEIEAHCRESDFNYDSNREREQF